MGLFGRKKSLMEDKLLELEKKYRYVDLSKKQNFDGWLEVCDASILILDERSRDARWWTLLIIKDYCSYANNNYEELKETADLGLQNRMAFLYQAADCFGKNAFGNGTCKPFFAVLSDIYTNNIRNSINNLRDLFNAYINGLTWPLEYVGEKSTPIFYKLASCNSYYIPGLLDLLRLDISLFEEGDENKRSQIIYDEDGELRDIDEAREIYNNWQDSNPMI